MCHRGLLVANAEFAARARVLRVGVCFGIGNPPPRGRITQRQGDYRRLIYRKSIGIE